MGNQIVITGFMASGKSTVAQALAIRLRRIMVDVDWLVLGREGRTAAQLIEQEGEAKFREIETRALQEVLSEAEPLVIGLGGGTWIVEENRELIAAAGATSVWLDAPFELCWKRIEAGQYLRPLAPTRAAAEKLFNGRYPIYQLADVRIVVDENESADEIAVRIHDEINSRI